MPARAPQPKEFRLMVIGGSGVGTTALNIRFYHDFFIPEDWDHPQGQISHRKLVVIDKQPCMLESMDKTWEQHSEVQPARLDSSIRDCDGILLVYSINSPTSLDEARAIHQHIKTVRASSVPSRRGLPIMLVGNKSDEAVEAQPLGSPPFPLPPRASRQPRSSSSLAAGVSWNRANCPLYRLPNEVLGTISRFLDLTSVVALCFASKRFYSSRLWAHANRCLSALNGLSLAVELGCGFIETSAKTGVNVHTAFSEMVRKMRQREAHYEGLKQQYEKRVAQKKRKSLFLYNPFSQRRGGPKCPFL